MNRKAFTLIEVAIVLMIIATLAAIAIPPFIKAREEALRRQGLLPYPPESSITERHRIRKMFIYENYDVYRCYDPQTDSWGMFTIPHKEKELEKL